MKHWKRILAIMLSVLLLATNIHNPTFASEDDMQYEDSEVKTETETNEEKDLVELPCESTETSANNQQDDFSSSSSEYRVETQSLIEPSPIEDFEYTELFNNEVIITNYVGSKTDIIIPASFGDLTVYGIGDSAFSQNDKIETVTLQPGISFIGEHAFNDCSALTSIIISEGVTSVGERAFEGCSSLKSIELPKGITEIGEYVFLDCISLEIAIIPSDMKYLPWGLFDGCVNLNDVELPLGVEEIQGVVFNNCYSLNTISIPESVKRIGYGAFWNCSNLQGPIDLSNVNIIDELAFCGCEKLDNVVLPNDLEIIEEGVFDYCSSLTSIEIPKNVKSIGTHAFQECSSLKSISIPKSVTSIGEYAFYGCTEITDLSLQGNLDIGEEAFFSCTSLKNVSLQGNICVGKNAFSYCESLTNLNLSNSVISIGDGAFSGCSSLQNLVIPAIEDIGIYAFSTCTSLSKVTIQDGLTFINEGMFNECSSLKTLVIPNSIINIKKYALWQCYNLTDVYYAGSASQWNKIVVDDNNDSLTNATIHCNYKPDPDDTEWSMIQNPKQLKNQEFKYTSEFSSADSQSWMYTFNYEDEWLFSDNKADQYELLKASLRVAMASFARDDDRTYSANIKAMMDTLGFLYSDESVQYVQPDINTIGYAIGMKNVQLGNGEVHTIILVAPRSGFYGPEWGGNFWVNNTDQHFGFSIAAYQVREGLNDFISMHKEQMQGPVKIWIVGYSRGAATANMLAATLDNGTVEGISKDNVCAFCFECPLNTTMKNAESALYDNIINIANPIDFVTKVAPVGWGFRRYGRSYYVPSYEVEWIDYASKHERMAEYYYDLCQYGTNPKHSSNDFSWTFEEFPDGLSPLGDRFRPTPVSELSWTKTLPVEKPEWNTFSYTNWGQASWFDCLFDKLSYTIPLDKFTNKHQANFINIAATTLGKTGEKDWRAFADGLVTIGTFAIEHPFIASSVVEMFRNGSGNFNCGAYPHFPELCLSWVDTLSGFDDYYTEERSHYRRSLINCPVNVTVYNSSNDIVAQIIDDEAQTIENGLITRIDEDGQKTVIMPANAEFRIEMEATDNGQVTYTVTEHNMATGEDERVVSYYEKNVEQGDILTGTIESCNEGVTTEYTLYLNDDETPLEADVDLADEEIGHFQVNVNSTGSGTITGGGNYVIGEFAQVTAKPAENAEFLGWYSGETKVSDELQYRFLVKEDTELTAKFTILLDEAEISEIPNQTYTGKVITPELTVSVNGYELKKDSDISFSYKNNINAGTATVTITGNGQECIGTRTVTFTIVPKKVTPTVSLSKTAYTYDGKVKKPTVTVKAGSKKLSTSDYTVTYAKGRKNVGKYAVKVTLKGNYSGSKTVYFKINPKGTTLATSTAASKAITVKWKKQSVKMASTRISGYQIQLATNSKFTKNVKNVTVKGYSSTSKKVTKLKGKTKYYIRIRTYKTVSGVKYYSPWSKAKTITTKA